MKRNFTKEHTRILIKNRHYYESLKKNGTVSKISSVTLEEFARIYKEAINNKPITLWCSACVIELIELLYINYDKFLQEEGALITSALHY